MGIFITPLWSEYIVSADQGGIFMDHFNVYSDIQARTGGEIYIGVVGPVRTGKSTFIKRFMELLVLPGLEDVHARERARDELPQSSAGKTIMTTEPKFIPKEAACNPWGGSEGTGSPDRLRRFHGGGRCRSY